MNILLRSAFFLPAVFVTTAFAIDTPVSHNDRSARQVKAGGELFRSLCASCHGLGARGDGPVAKLLVDPPADLTRIAQRNAGRFPADTVHRTIDGREARAVHGPRTMPVWGQQLYYSAKSEDPAARARTDAQIALLVEYIRSIQQP